MLVFPQLSTGASGQFPVRRRRVLRSLRNQLEDGRVVKIADWGGVLTEWRLEYKGLTDEEAAAVEGLFQKTEGRVGSFVFLDPVGNLLAWSEQLDEPVWVRSPLIRLTGGVQDPLGTTRAWQVDNDGAASGQLVQTLEVPDSYSYCLSLWARGSGELGLVRGGETVARRLSTEWRRLSFAAESSSGAESVSFGLEILPGASMSVFGLQAEAQRGASGYKKTTARGGVYQKARFDQDELRVVATDAGSYSCTIDVTHGDNF